MHDALSRIRFFVRSVLRDTRGSNAAEYIIVGALVVAVVFAGVKTFGEKVNNHLSRANSAIQ